MVDPDSARVGWRAWRVAIGGGDWLVGPQTGVTWLPGEPAAAVAGAHGSGVFAYLNESLAWRLAHQCPPGVYVVGLVKMWGRPMPGRWSGTELAFEFGYPFRLDALVGDRIESGPEILGTLRRMYLGVDVGPPPGYGASWETVFGHGVGPIPDYGAPWV